MTRTTCEHRSSLQRFSFKLIVISLFAPSLLRVNLVFERILCRTRTDSASQPRPTGRAVLKERLAGTLMSEPPCARQGVPHGQTESGGIVLAVTCWAPSAQRRCYPTGRCAHRPSVTSGLSINPPPPPLNLTLSLSSSAANITGVHSE